MFFLLGTLYNFFLDSFSLRRLGWGRLLILPHELEDCLLIRLLHLLPPLKVAGVLDHLGGCPGLLECLENAGRVVIVLHLSVIAEGTRGYFGNSYFSLLDFLLTLLTPSLNSRV